MATRLQLKAAAARRAAHLCCIAGNAADEAAARYDDAPTAENLSEAQKLHTLATEADWDSVSANNAEYQSARMTVLARKRWAKR